PDDAGLAPGTSRLPHRGKSNRVKRSMGLVDRPNGRVARLGYAGVGEPRPHRDLVRHQVRGLRADPGQPETLRDRGDDWYSTVGRDGQSTVDFVPAPNLGDGLHVREVDDLADVGVAEAERLRVTVDADDAQPEVPRAPNRAPLVPARADKENRRVHPGARC